MQFVYRSDSGDWRSHLEMMKTHHNGLTDISSLVTSNLSKISTDIENAMQKMGKREKLINNQFDLMLTQYRALQVRTYIGNDLKFYFILLLIDYIYIHFVFTNLSLIEVFVCNRVVLRSQILIQFSDNVFLR